MSWAACYGSGAFGAMGLHSKNSTANNLTLVAALPQAGGFASRLPAEKSEPVTVRMKASYFEFDELVFPPIDLGMVEGNQCS